MESFSKARWAGRRDALNRYLTDKYGDNSEQLASSDELRTLHGLNEKITIAVNVDSAQNDGYQTGQEDAEYILSRKEMSPRRLLEENDFSLDKLNDAANRRNSLIAKFLLTGLVLLIAGIIIWSLPCFREGRVYDELVENPSESRYSEYVRDFPEGRHRHQADSLMEQMFYDAVMDSEYGWSLHDAINTYRHWFSDWPRADEVTWREPELTLRDALTFYAFMGKRDGNEIVESLNGYLDLYPDGKKAAYARQMLDSVTDVNIDMLMSESVFGRNVKGGGAFKKKFYDYLRERGVRKVVMQIESSNELKDYEDLDDREKAIVDRQNITPHPVMSIVKNFPESAVGVFEISSRENFRTSLTCDSVKTWLELVRKADDDPDAPVVKLRITLRDLQSGGVPTLYLYQEGPFVYDYSGRSALLHSKPVFVPELIFDTEITLPATGEQFNFTVYGPQMPDMRNLQSLADGYKKYCSTAPDDYPFGKR